MGKVNRVFGRLKRTKIYKKAPRLVIDHLTIALTDKGEQMPLQLTERRAILTRYSLNMLADFQTWTIALQSIGNQDIPTPVCFSELSLEEIQNATSTSQYGELLTSIRQSARIEFCESKRLTPITLQFRQKNFSLLGALRAQNVEESAFGIEL